MQYYVLGDEDTVLGFGMVGVAGRAVDGAEEAAAAFDEACADRELGILIVTERVAELIRPRVDRLVYSDDFPLIVEIPDRQGRLPGRPGIRDTVNAAIGIKLG